MNKSILKAIELATEEALNIGAPLNFKHSAVCLKKGKVTGVGINSHRTNWVQRIYARRLGLNKKLAEHAEFAALRSADGIADTLVVVRVGADGKLLNSKPCKICALMLKESDVKHLYFSNDQGIEYVRL